MKYWGFVAALMMLYVLFSNDSTANNKGVLPQKLPASTLISQNLKKKSQTRQPASSTNLTTAIQKDIDQLKKLKDCYETRTCSFPETDPKSYEFALGKQIQSELMEFRKKYSQDLRHSKELIRVAKEFLMTGDGFVQEEAIHLLSSLPPSQESLVAITEGLYSTPDPKLMEQALGEFQRYLGSPWENQVHSFLGQTLATGAQFSAITVSEKIMPFVNDKSYKSYQQTLLNMAPGSRASKNLNAALKEYRRLQTGA